MSADPSRRAAQRAWCFYDWANSAFATSVVSAILPVYFARMAAKSMPAHEATAMWGYASAAALAVTAVLSPVMGALADQSRRRKPLLLGCVLEGTTILLVIVPVLIPTAEALGIDMVHFGVVVVVNIMLGLVTPPYGLLLFIMTRIAEVPLKEIVLDVLPFLYTMIVALALLTFFPALVLWLPRLMGYQG